MARLPLTVAASTAADIVVACLGWFWVFNVFVTRWPASFSIVSPRTIMLVTHSICNQWGILCVMSLCSLTISFVFAFILSRLLASPFTFFHFLSSQHSLRKRKKKKGNSLISFLLLKLLCTTWFPFASSIGTPTGLSSLFCPSNSSRKWDHNNNSSLPVTTTIRTRVMRAIGSIRLAECPTSSRWSPIFAFAQP